MQKPVDKAQNDAEWKKLNRDSLIHASESNWGLFRNDHFQMGEFLRKEQNFLGALEQYLFVFYIDMNGPQNIGGFRSIKVPSWDPSRKIIAPGLINRIYSVQKKQNITLEYIQSVFLENSEKQQKDLLLPVSPQEAWGKLKIELE